MRPATAADLEAIAMRPRGQKLRWQWQEMAMIPGRTFTLEEGYDYEYGNAIAPDRSARRWAKRRQIKVSVRHDKINGRVLVTFSPSTAPKRRPKWDAAMASGAWIDCAYHERERAQRHADATGFGVVFQGRRARFIPPSKRETRADG